MSSTRKVTAFARRPRGTPSSVQKPTLNLSGGLLHNIDKVRMDTNVKQVLNKSQSTLEICVNADEQARVFIRNPAGQIIGNYDDVKKIAAMQTTINEQRKEAQKEAVNDSFKKMLFALKERSEELHPETYENPIVPKSFLEIYRQIALQMANLNFNMEVIRKTQQSDLSAICLKYLEASAIRISNAVADYLITRFNEPESKEKLNTFLYRRKVFIWVFTRLTSSKFPPANLAFDCSTVLFPRNAAKGLQGSFKEIRDVEFCQNQLGLLKNCGLILTFFRNDVFVKTFCNIPLEDSLADIESNQLFQQLANVPIMLLPPIIDSKEIVSQAAKKGSQEFSWDVGSYSLNYRSNLKFLGTLFKKASVLSIPQPHRAASVLEKIYAGFSYDRSNRDKGITVQLSEHTAKMTPSDLSKSKWYAQIAVDYDETARKRGFAMFRYLMAINFEEHGDDYRVLAECFGLSTNELMTAEQKFRPVRVPNGEVDAEDGFGHLTQKAKSYASKEPRVESFVKEHFDAVLAQKKVKKIPTALVQSRKGAFAQQLEDFLKSKGYHAVGERLGGWLTTFTNVELQGYVAELITAKFLDFWSKPIEYSRADRMNLLLPSFEEEEGLVEDDGNNGGEEEPTEEAPEEADDLGQPST